MDTEKAVIKVIGIGRCGVNAISHMMEQGINGVEFIAIDTEAQTRSLATTQLKIRVAMSGNAEADCTGANREQIRSILDGADMVFIIAGMGGDTEVATIVAGIARAMNILTVALLSQAAHIDPEASIKAHEHVDALIVVPNVCSMNTMPEKFTTPDQSMRRIVAEIAGMINEPGLIGIDFTNLRSILSKSGMALMGSATASGPDRAKVATERAIENMDISGARGVLINITSSDSFKLRELSEMMDYIHAAEDATLILGSVFDESMGDELRVTVLATGLSVPQGCD